MTTIKEVHGVSLPAGFALASGIIILITSSLFYFWHTGFSGMGGMMGQWFVGYVPFYSVTGLICGGIITVGGFMMYNRSFEMRMWGWIVLIISAISLFEMLGIGVGPILGMVGGAIAITRGRRIQQLR